MLPNLYSSQYLHFYFFSQLGFTALMKAAGEGHSKIVELLLKAGANVNERVPHV